MEQKKQTGKILKVAGPLVVAVGLPDVKMYEVVKVGEKRLSGEVIRIEDEKVFIQAYEETSGIGPGEPVVLTGESLAVELGPGLLGNIYDGIQRPLKDLKKESGDFIKRGIEAPALDKTKKWKFRPLKKQGDQVTGGDILGEVEETESLKHRIMVPPYIGNSLVMSLVSEGEYAVEQEIAELKEKGKTYKISMLQKWPIRNPRPVKNKILPQTGLVTGQRVIDTFFPIAKGGAACVPGPFGSGKTVVQHQISKWSDADIVIYLACGERGNEVADVLAEFPELKDPKTGRPLMERTVIIANTSNMPVAAREASIYTGMTIGEYFRDMGYSVIILADSTSRWAEALREMSGRLEEMPGDEGYPAYLGSRTAAFYERAGAIECLGDEKRNGYLSVVGAVSPPGGDLSEPVTQNTLRVTKVFWALDSALAYKRHFPAINWLNSYTLYEENLKDFFEQEAGKGFNEIREKALAVLQKEAELEEIVRLVGAESLSQRDQFLLQIAKIIREDFLQQNAFLDIDSYTSLRKQFMMLKTIIDLYDSGLSEIEQGKGAVDVLSSEIKEKLAKMKFIPEDKLETIKF